MSDITVDAIQLGRDERFIKLLRVSDITMNVVCRPEIAGHFSLVETHLHELIMYSTWGTCWSKDRFLEGIGFLTLMSSLSTGPVQHGQGTAWVRAVPAQILEYKTRAAPCLRYIEKTFGNFAC